MIVFPNAKINVGLRVLRKRPDGYHDLESVFIPAPWFDVLEIVTSNQDHFFVDGLKDEVPMGQNLVEKARDLFRSTYSCPPVDIHVKKYIPSGAGLGGGSSDASHTLKALRDLFHPQVPNVELEKLAAQLGSDCAFFIENKPAYILGTGSEIKVMDWEFPNCYIIMVFPGFPISTREAFQNVIPNEHAGEKRITEIIEESPNTWNQLLGNDFEQGLFPRYPELAHIKKGLTDSGAFYVSMSGSGSTVYGLFLNKPDLRIQDEVRQYKIGKLGQKSPVFFE